MCWYTTNISNVRPKIAKKPVTVYKVMVSVEYKAKENIFSKILRTFFKKFLTVKIYHPYFRSFTYVEGEKTVKVPIEVEHNTCYWKIEEGYHSVSSVRALKYIDPAFDHILVECVIPKGTVYYENESNEVVSESLIVKKQLSYKNIVRE